jgi:hypothetical protein
MPLIVTFIPLVTAALFVAGSIISTPKLARLAVFLLILTLLANLFLLPNIVAGYVYVTNVGTWVTSGLLDIT